MDFHLVWIERRFTHVEAIQRPPLSILRVLCRADFHFRCYNIGLRLGNEKQRSHYEQGSIWENVGRSSG